MIEDVLPLAILDLLDILDPHLHIMRDLGPAAEIIIHLLLSEGTTPGNFSLIREVAFPLKYGVC